VEIREILQSVDAILEADQRDVVEEAPAVVVAALDAQIGRRVMGIGEAMLVNERRETLGDVGVGAGIGLRELRS
jgi:hypothetical protein